MDEEDDPTRREDAHAQDGGEKMDGVHNSERISSAQNQGLGQGGLLQQRRPRAALVHGGKRILQQRPEGQKVGLQGESTSLDVVASRTKLLDVNNATHARLLRGWHVSEDEQERLQMGGAIAQVDLHMCRLRNGSKLDFKAAAAHGAAAANEGIEYVHVDASLNYFEQVPRDLEACASCLRSLDLSLNQIREPSTLAAFSKLTVLKLARNGIEQLPTGFAAHCEDLRELDLSCNKLRALPMLPGLRQLRTLNLRGNELTVLRGVSDLPSLEVLSLASNRLEDVVELSRVPTLRSLDLAGNRLADLLEARDIVLCLGQLEELKLLGNPIAKERNYRMVIYENASIVKFDNFKVTRAARSQWKHRKLQADMDLIIHQTSSHYMRWIEREAVQKQVALDMLRKREEEIQAAFVAYRQSMEAELEECIRYMQDLAENPHEYDASFLGSIDGHKQWQAYLDAADTARADVYESELSRMRTALEQRVLIKSETDDYVSKLRLLARERPSVWRDIKQKELAKRLTQEDVDANERSQAEEAREAARGRLHDRAAQRAADLREVATSRVPPLEAMPPLSSP